MLQSFQNNMAMFSTSISQAILMLTFLWPFKLVQCHLSMITLLGIFGSIRNYRYILHINISDKNLNDNQSQQNFNSIINLNQRIITLLLQSLHLLCGLLLIAASHHLQLSFTSAYMIMTWCIIQLLQCISNYNGTLYILGISGKAVDVPRIHDFRL